jgi:hypothetical protein
MPPRTILSPRNGRYRGQVLADKFMHKSLNLISALSVKSWVINLMIGRYIQ